MDKEGLEIMIDDSDISGGSRKDDRTMLSSRPSGLTIMGPLMHTNTRGPRSKFNDVLASFNSFHIQVFHLFRKPWLSDTIYLEEVVAEGLLPFRVVLELPMLEVPVVIPVFSRTLPFYITDILEVDDVADRTLAYCELLEIICTYHLFPSLSQMMLRGAESRGLM